MKKQFLRVKQYADQTFLKAEKTEALNNKELQIADQKVDYLRSSLNNIIKRLPLNQISEGNVEKRMKKYPEYLLGQSLHDQSQRSIDSECKLLQSILKECACVELELAKEQSEHESKVEQLVSAPIQTVIDNDLPNIFKHKRNLNKYILDKDSASNRYYSSKNGNNKDTLKDNMEEADVKVEQYRDILATEMFHLLRKECELSQHMLQLLKLQRAYHESALKSLEKIIPALETKITDSPSKAVFGLDLAEHLRISNRRIAFPLELCIRALTELGLSEEGLFRVVGAASKVKRLKLAIDSGCFSFPLISEYTDVHVLASTLKSYLRDLPEPLLTYKLYDEWIDCMRYSHDERILVIQQILKKLPEVNRDNLTYLIQFFAKLSKNIENKMNASNIAIVIAPNLLWKETKEIEMNMGSFAMLNMIVEMFVSNVNVLFPDNVDCYLTIPSSEIIIEESEFSRPILSNVKLLNTDMSDLSNYSTENIFHDTSSPKPQIRRKAKLAPPVPHTSKNEMDFSNDRSNISPSYPSGSTTLNRSHKPKSTSEVKSVVLNSQTLEDSPSPRRQSLIIDPANIVMPPQEIVNPPLVNLEYADIADISYVSQPSTHIQVSKAKPIQQVSAQTLNIDKINITASNIQTTISGNQQNAENKIVNKPIAAPRPSLICDNKQPIDANKTTNLKVDTPEEIEIGDGEYVQLRKPFNDNINERPNKPAVPVRPASLKAPQRTNSESSNDVACQKTQCSVFSLANKQHASYVNIQNKNLNSEKFQAGHDMQMAEKERFLGHHIDKPPSSIENKRGDVNFNNSETIRNRTSSVGSQNKPEIPPKSSVLKSNEKLDLKLPMEKFNGNTKSSHTRTHSDGNLIETMSPVSSFAHTPPSPRTLSKPTQPPPPPPTGVSRPKSNSDSTDL